MIPITRSTIATAWLEALEQLASVDGDAFSVIVSVERPGEARGSDVAVRDYLDRQLLAHRLQDTQTVANTIFPIELAKGRSAANVYDAYRTKAWPVLRRITQNQRGTYFLRMIERENPETEVPENPLQKLIAKINAELSRGHHVLRSAYELAIYDPLKDSNIRMGFPCLSHVSIKVDPHEKLLHLSATYRNQRFFERAFGNYLGLARLQAFIARETGLSAGTMVCHATHAEIDHLGKAELRELLNDGQRLLGQSV